MTDVDPNEESLARPAALKGQAWPLRKSQASGEVEDITAILSVLFTGRSAISVVLGQALL